MKVRCDNCSLLYERNTRRDIMAKALVNAEDLQEDCPRCKSNASTPVSEE